MDKYPNDVGAAWKKRNDKGDYLSVSLDVDKLLKLSGGETGQLSLNMYPIQSDHPKAPDYSLKFYPKAGVSTRAPRPLNDTDEAPRARRPLADEEIPF
jgi:hypothetical protein